MQRPSKKAKRYTPKVPSAGTTTRYVVPVHDHWAVRKEGAVRASGLYVTRVEAEKAANEMVRRRGGGTVRVQGRDGRWRECFTLGRGNFDSISAVEGIRLSREMKQDFREFDRKGLSAAERREAIVRKYGKGPA